MVVEIYYTWHLGYSTQGRQSVNDIGEFHWSSATQGGGSIEWNIPASSHRSAATGAPAKSTPSELQVSK